MYLFWLPRLCNGPLQNVVVGANHCITFMNPMGQEMERDSLSLTHMVLALAEKNH